MANNEKSKGWLTNNQIVRLAAAVSSRDMESIALGYLNIEDETIKNVKYENKDNAEVFNRGIIRRWTYQNPGHKQTQVSQHLRSSISSGGSKGGREGREPLPRGVQILSISCSF